MSDFRIRLLIGASNLPVPLSRERIPTIPVVFGAVTGGGTPPPSPGDGELDFSYADNSGLLALFMEDF